MRNINIRSALSALAAITFIANAYSQATGNSESLSPSAGKEPPRTRTVSYNNEENAIRNHEASSIFFQALNEQWSSLKDGNETVMSNTFKVPFSWFDRQVLLHVGASSSSYFVLINGTMAGHDRSSSLPAEYDITSYCIEGLNEIQIKLFEDEVSDNIENRIPGAAPRLHDVFITAQPRIRIRDFVSNSFFAGPDATLELGAVVKSNFLNKKDVRVHYSLLDNGGFELSNGYRDVELSMRQEDTVRFLLNITNAKAWNHEMPYLYTILFKVRYEGRVTEYVSYRVGLRNVAHSGGSLTINSNPVALTVRSFSTTGSKEGDEAILQQYRREGVNMIKNSTGYMPSHVYELCDAMGIYICCQIPIDTSATGGEITVGGNIANDPGLEQFFIQRVITGYYTTRNHPSVVMYSLASGSPNGYNMYESYLKLKDIDKNIPVIYTDAGGQWNSDAVTRQLAQNNPKAAAGRIIFDEDMKDNVFSVYTEPIVELINDREGVYIITNNNTTTTINSTINYEVKQGRNIVSRGSMPVSVDPQSQREVRIPLGTAVSGKKLKYNVSLN